ncbi:MAG: aminotransferase class V-fold PLP-dependent enzyme, partial [Patescibacteria group bacterium]|nr:aminotransferase class V-fold PLP-dependent enzyme [Patescibacteria group bacterium]
NARYPLFHTDAAQAPLYVDLNAEKLGVDLMTLDASKAYGPRGIGLLYVRRGTPIEPIIYGGGQEHGLRSGTENIPAIMGFACALEIAVHDRAAETERITALKECFWRELLAVEPRIRVQGPAPLGVLGRHFSRDDESAEVAMSLRHERSLPCAPHILNVSIPDIDNEFFVLQLDARGIACSTKSSCLRNEDESYVLRALGLDSRTSVRFSFGRWTKRRHVESAVRAIRRILAK